MLRQKAVCSGLTHLLYVALQTGVIMQFDNLPHYKITQN